MGSEEAEFDVGLGLDGVHVAITGAGGHIGSILVRAFLAAKCLVTAIDLDAAKLDLLPEHGRLRCSTADITNEEVVGETFEAAAKEFGMVSVCVAAAGKDLSYLKHHETMADMPLSQWQETMRVNGQGTFLTARAWMKGLRQRGEKDQRNISMILIGSEAGSMGVRMNADYAASKAMMIGLVKSLASDVVGLHPVARVNLLEPGAVDTSQFRQECAEDAQARWVESEATVALKRPVAIDHLARTCLFLASERYAGSVTGQIIRVDCGKSGKLLWTAGGQMC